MDIAIALHKLNPNYYYSCVDNNYNNLIMLDNNLKPSLLELHNAWHDYLNNEAKADCLKRLEIMAENERMRYVTSGDGKAMAYQQQRREVELWVNSGYVTSDPTMYPVASQIALRLATTTAIILGQWQQNINAWLIIGGKIEANLAKAKADLVAMQVVNQSDLDNFLANINWQA